MSEEDSIITWLGFLYSDDGVNVSFDEKRFLAKTTTCQEVFDMLQKEGVITESIDKMRLSNIKNYLYHKELKPEDAITTTED